MPSAADIQEEGGLTSNCNGKVVCDLDKSGFDGVRGYRNLTGEV